MHMGKMVLWVFSSGGSDFQDPFLTRTNILCVFWNLEVPCFLDISVSINVKEMYNKFQFADIRKCKLQFM